MAPQDQKKTFLKDLATRVASALVLIPLIIYLVVKGGFYVKGLLIALTFLLGYEYARLTRLSDKTRAVFTAGVFATIWWLFAMSYGEGFIDGMMVMAIAGATVIGVGVILKKVRMCWAGFGVAYISIPMFSLALIALNPLGGSWLLWMLALVWANDSGAYLFGKAIGGPKLVPAISPKKTWAGLAGGVVMAAGAGAGAAYYLELANLFFLDGKLYQKKIRGQGFRLSDSRPRRSFGPGRRFIVCRPGAGAGAGIDGLII
ncbi:MAG: phosphatidate cytidylyltransferase [Proteobacteria bacterium]|nr:phosphatidate cytidylyltransferase [Pseudomonadota bacterium]